MKKTVVFLAVILAVGWYGNHYSAKRGLTFKQGVSRLSNTVKDSLFGRQNGQSSTELVSYADLSKPERASNNSRFKCDGRTRCSQMTSCEEAIFFINNCPDTKMDGDNDGIPCESQWCN